MPYNYFWLRTVQRVGKRFGRSLASNTVSAGAASPNIALFHPGYYLAQRVDIEEEQVDLFTHYASIGWRDGNRPHPLFDPSFYFMQRPDVLAAGIEPLQHYIEYGWRDGNQPHPMFDPSFYLIQRPDVQEAGIEPLSHYLNHGWLEGTKPHPLFDPGYYLAQRPDLQEYNIEPLTHYAQYGSVQTVDPHTLFYTNYYLDQGVTLGGLAPLHHYLIEGRLANFKTHHLFDPIFYVSQRPDLQSSGIDPLTHYVRYGWREGTRPHPLFSPSYFLAQRPDLIAAEVEPLAHYIRNGASETGDPHPLFFTEYYLSGNTHTGGLAPLAHYLLEGWRRGLTPHHLFDPEHFEKFLPSQITSNMAPLSHYAVAGWETTSIPHPLFDTGFYISQVSSRGQYQTPLEHYIFEGWRESLRPHALFDPGYYAAHEPDAIGESPLSHYVRFGRERGARTTEQKIPNIIEKLLASGDLVRAASLYTAFAPVPLQLIRKTVVLPVVQLLDYARDRNCVIHEFPQEWINVPRPKLIGDTRYDLKEGSLACPSAFVIQLHDAMLVGGTRVVITSDGFLLHDEIYRNRLDPHLLIKPISIVSRIEGDMALIHLERRPTDQIEAGILLSADHDYNYFHWMVEVLPKLAMIDTLDDFHDYPLLVRGDLNPNLLRALALANRRNRRIIHLVPNAAYRIKHIIYPSDICRTVDREGGEILFESDCLLSPRWLKASAVAIMQSLPLRFEPATKRPLFLTRQQGLRRITNIQDLEVWFGERDFAVETFQDVSLDYQIMRSERAEIFVAVTGAAVTNMMFCPPGSNIIVLMSSHHGQNPYVWQQLATCFGHRLTLVVGPRRFARFEHPIHDNYSIDIELLETATSNLVGSA